MHLAVLSRKNRPSLLRSQAGIVALLALTLFGVFAGTIDGYLSLTNMVNLMRNVAVLGILSIGMGVVVIGRGIDLSIVPTMIVSVAICCVVASAGVSAPIALGAGATAAVLIGAVNGLLTAYLEIPALFATLAWGMVVLGLGNYYVYDTFLITLPQNLGVVIGLGTSQILGIPLSVFIFFVLAAGVHLCLSRSHMGRLLFALGDNPAAARIGGVPIRGIRVAKYAGVGALAFLAGLIMTGAVNEMNARLAFSTLPFDVILVVVIGGIGLSGGRGGMHNVVVGTLLIGILSNGMTILNIAYTDQKILQALVLLTAIVIDGVLNPRDEQTSQQGDI